MTILLSAGLLSACSDFFDQVPNDRLSTEKIFETKAGTEKYLASVYTYIPDEANQRLTSGPWTAGCDEAEYVWGFVSSQLVNNNTLTATEEVDSRFWKQWYSGIHTATVFMQNVHTSSDVTEAMAKQWTAEARALRAIYYFYLLRAYGPVPIIGEKIISLNASVEEVQLPRNTVDECVDYIVSELTKAMSEGLLEHVSLASDGIGRIDQTIAQAFKIEALMLKASPLFNGSVPYYASLQNTDSTYLFPQHLTKDQKIARWKEAADTAAVFLKNYEGKYYDLERVYTTSGQLDPYLSYRKALRGAYTNLSNYKELIFYRIFNSTSVMQYDRTPYHSGAPNSDYKASGGLGATQEMVDAYFMANGKLPISGYEADGVTPIINPESGYEETGYISSAYLDPVSGVQFAPKRTYKMYTKREPRFYANITFNGQKWLNEKDGIVYTDMTYNGNSGKAKGLNDYSKTGYVVRKCAPEGAWQTEDRVCILMRLPQVYLNYIEALNESQPGHPDILKYLNLIRERAGIPQYGTGSGQLPVPADQVAMRQAIRAERTVELMFENVRYFDVRRWGIANETQNKAIYGMNIEGDGTAFYKRTKVEDRVFENRQYFFPIPQGEIDVNKKLVQNPGY
ncbi:MAG: RagB/SusD family nutrient uptake outer membrane protein [Bacteroidota bacterium]|nr:RagB/SusD family nutrient uptake outer membrane protein [Bacteroidota bacterium]